MRKRSLSSTHVLVVVATLLAATAVALLSDAVWFSPRKLDSARAFQRMVGGLGLGATVRPRWCFVNYDPRLQGCTCAERPLPGGYCYCPEHGGTVTFFEVPRPATALAAPAKPTGP